MGDTRAEPGEMSSQRAPSDSTTAYAEVGRLSLAASFIDQQIDEVEQPRIVSNQNDHVDTWIQDVHDLENRLCAGKVDIVVLKQSRRNLKCLCSDFSRLHGTYSSGGQNQVWRESLLHK